MRICHKCGALRSALQRAACVLGMVSTALAGLGPATVRAADVEVLHWWTSGSEARSVEELKRLLAQQGVGWRDSAVAGGGGDKAIRVLQEQMQAGKAPAAAQVKGPMIQTLGRQGALASLDDIAREQRWDVALPKQIRDLMQVDGHFVAAPVNIHRVDWLWINKRLLDRVGGVAPKSWPAFFALADRFRQAGILPLAHGGQDWQDFTLFEIVAVSAGGPEFYRRALVDRDPAAIRSDKMIDVLTTFRRIKAYTDPGSPGREWNAATAMVVQGEAAMQFMGDWAKGEFTAAGKKPSQDYLCASVPNGERSYIFNIDSFVTFTQKDPKADAARRQFVRALMSPGFQRSFNLSKGSIPAVSGGGVDLSSFDQCAQASAAYFVASSMVGGLVPSVAHKMALPDAAEASTRAVVNRFWNTPTMTPAAAVEALVGAAATR